MNTRIASDSISKTNEIRFEGNRGHGWTIGTFTASPGHRNDALLLRCMSEVAVTPLRSPITRGRPPSKILRTSMLTIGNCSVTARLGWELTHTGRELDQCRSDVSDPVTSNLPMGV